MKDKFITLLALAIAVMGVVHIIATFTPLIGGGLEVLPQAKHNAMIYMSLMCGALLIVCGLLASMLYGKVKEYPFLHKPFVIIIIALIADGITAVVYMSHNPFAWVVFVLIACLAVTSSIHRKSR